MSRRGKRWSLWSTVAGASVWAVSFYQAYVGLAIPAFGPAEQGAAAVHNLSLRYAIYLIVGTVVWGGLRRVLRRHKRRVHRVKVRSLG